MRVRQFTRRAEAPGGGALARDDIESMAGCDLYLVADGLQFRGGTRGRDCVQEVNGEARWIDYRVVIGEGLFWYRKRTSTLADDALIEEIAGIPDVDLSTARLFSCDISGSSGKPAGGRRTIGTVELHDRGGRADFRTPDGRVLRLELHGRDWPLSPGRQSLVLLLSSESGDGHAAGEPIGSSWTSLDAARVGIDLGWLAVDCAPVVSETGEQPS